MQLKTQRLRIRRPAAALLALALACLGTPWAARADVVVLRNGKELHGLVEDGGDQPGHQLESARPRVLEQFRDQTVETIHLLLSGAEEPPEIRPRPEPRLQGLDGG